MHFPFERIFESKTEQTEQKCTFIAMYILDYQKKNNMCTLSYIEMVSFKPFKIFSFALSIMALSKESK